MEFQGIQATLLEDQVQHNGGSLQVLVIYICLAYTLRGEAKEVRHSWSLTSPPTSTVDQGVSQWLSAAAALWGRDSGELMSFTATCTKTSKGPYIVKPMAT